jgi:hypothetical protein
MGLLDDAIREHLDLKRRHGASDDEIAQKEAEALGPARREFPRAAEQEVPVAEAPVHVEEETVHPLGDPLEEEIAEPPVFDPPVLPESAVEPPPVEPAPEPRAELADTEEYRFEDDDFEDEDDEGGYGDEDDDDDELDDDDLGFDDEEEEEDEDEDVLGDTPDFLQDSPEHDRLWFEQKPPRDFDFE